MKIENPFMVLICQAMGKQYRSYDGSDAAEVFGESIFYPSFSTENVKKPSHQCEGFYVMY